MQKRAISILLILAIIFTLVPMGTLATGAENASWAGAMNMNAENNQVTGISIPYSPEKTVLKWQYGLNTKDGSFGAFYAGQSVIVGDYLYATGGGNLHKIKTTDGTLVKTVKAGSSSFNYDYLCYGNNKIFVATSNSVEAFELSDLTKKWTVSVNNGSFHPIQYINSSPTDYVYCNGNVLSVSTGDKITIKNIDNSELDATFNWSSGAIVNGYFYVASTMAVYAIDISTWKVNDIWEYGVSNTLAPGVSYSAETGRIYFGSYSDSNIYSVKLNGHSFDNNSKIEKKVSQKTCCTPIIYNGRVYLPGQNGNIDVLDSETLETIYTAEGSGGKIQGNAILSTSEATDENLYTVYLVFQCYDGNLYVLEDNKNSNSGNVIKIADTPNPSNVSYPNSFEQIAIDDKGNIYCYNESGYLFCFSKTNAYLNKLLPSKGKLTKDFSGGTESYELILPAGETNVCLDISTCNCGVVSAGANSSSLEMVALTNGSGSITIENVTTSPSTYYIKVTCGYDSRLYLVSVRQKKSETGIRVVTSMSNNITEDTVEVTPHGNVYTVTNMSGKRVWLGLEDENASIENWTIIDGALLNLSNLSGTDRYNGMVYQKRVFNSSFKEGQVLASATVKAEDGKTTATYYFAFTCADEFKKTTETVYVTISDKGSLVTGNNSGSTHLADVPVIVTDINNDGRINIDEALYATHEAYYSGTDSKGYETEETQYGLSIKTLWGDTSGCFGYWVNGESAWSLDDTVSSGDYVKAFIYKDQSSWTDIYTEFSSRNYTATAGTPITLKLNAYTFNNTTFKYDIGAYEGGASVSAVEAMVSGMTNGKGEVILTFPFAGSYTVIASEPDGSIVPAVCKVTVNENTPPASKITVRFSLFGDKAHGSGGTVHSYKSGNLETWISATNVTSDENSTVLNVLKKVLDANGYTYEGHENNYICSITTPSGLKLSEYTNGPNSGWMYLVNGVSPLVGINDYVLSNGDSIVFFYTDDYTKERGSETFNPSNPIKSNETITPLVTAQNGMAETAINAEAISKALEGNSAKITIAPVISGKADSVSITIPSRSVQDIVNKSFELSIVTEHGSLSLPKEALDSIEKKANNSDLKITIQLKPAKDIDIPEAQLMNALIVEIKISLAGQNITSFDGSNIKVSIPVKENYEVGETYKVIVISSDGAINTYMGYVSELNGDLYVDVSVNHLSTFVVTTEPFVAFNDVKSGEWYYEAVQYTARNGIMKGVGENSFAPNLEISRAMMVTILYRLSGSPKVTGVCEYSDVIKNEWYSDAIVWASKNGIVNGRGNGTFGVNDSLTREEASAVLYRYSHKKGLDISKRADLSGYIDANQVSPWSYNEMRWANAVGFIKGTSVKELSPKGNMTRAQTATIIMRLNEYSKDAPKNEVSKITSDTAAYVLKTVTSPQIGSVGGEWAVIGLVRSGYDIPKSWTDMYYKSAEKSITSCNGILSKTKYTEFSRVILGLTAIGKTAANISGYDLTFFLSDYENVTKQGLNGAIWALIALDSRNFNIPVNSKASVQATREMYVNEILSSQLANGGFSITGMEPGDIDMTAMAICALSRYKTQSDVALAITKAISYLSEKQEHTGAYDSCESTAQVIIALNSLGISINDSSFVKNEKNLYDGLLSYYAGDGQFRHLIGGEVNQMATEQALLALAALERSEKGSSSLYDMSDVK